MSTFDLPNRSVLSWLDRQGQSLGVVGSPGYYDGMCLSRDDSRVVFAEMDFRSSNIDLRTLEFARGAQVPLTFDPALDLFPVCSADATRESSGGGNVRGDAEALALLSCRPERHAQLVTAAELASATGR